MKLFFLLALSFIFSLQDSFAQKQSPFSTAKLATEPFVLDSMAILPPSSFAEQPCGSPTDIACGQTLSNQNNLASSGWTSNFGGPAYVNCGGNAGATYQAPDRLYQFTVNTATNVTITLDILQSATVDLDLFLLSVCSPATCLAASRNNPPLDEAINSVFLNPGTYYIVVDGYGGDTGSFDISLSFSSGCGGGGGGCNNLSPIACGELLNGQTTIGQANNFTASSYNACNVQNSSLFNAADKEYEFTLTSDQEVNISMEILSANTDLDMFLLSSCSPAICYDLSGSNTPFESIQTYLTAGTYYIVVDGFNGAQGNFNIQLSCTCNCGFSVGDLLSCEGFEDFAPNSTVSPNSVRWNKWSNALGDASVQTDGSNQYLEMKPNGNPTPDVWFNLGTNTSGRYRLSFKMQVETGKKGIYYLLHQAPNSNGANANSAYTVFFDTDGFGYVLQGASPNNEAKFKYLAGEWVDVVQIIDLSQDVVELWVGGEFVDSWDFSIGSAGFQLRLDALNFDADDASYSYLVDDICFRGVGICGIAIGDPVCIENGTQALNAYYAGCGLYTEDEITPCNTVCDFGGKFIYRGDKFSGSFDASDRAPWSVQTQSCVQLAYGADLPSSLFADIYVFSRPDDNDIIINYKDNGNPNVRAFVFACVGDTFTVGKQQDMNNLLCADGEFCREFIPAGNTNFSSIALNACHNFYYLVIMGTLGETYSDLNIVPNGNCPSNPQIINCGDVVAGAVGFPLGGIPPPFESVGEAYAACYSGFRQYTGGEEFYKFILDRPAQVTINLTASAPNPSPMGVFLFSFLCGSNCLDYAENTAFDASAILSANLSEGVYYLAIDKDQDVGNSNFTLSLNCNNYPYSISTESFILGDFNCPTDPVPLPHLVLLNPSSTLVSTDYIEFYFKDVNGLPKGNLESSQYWHNDNSPQDFNLRADDLSDLPKCSYVEGDTFYVFIHQTEEGKSTYKQYEPTFAATTGGGITDSLKFRPGGTSRITKLTEIKTINFVPVPSTTTAPPAPSTRTMIFSSGVPWALERLTDPAPWLTISPTASTQTQTLTFTFEENFSPLPRKVVLRFYPTSSTILYQQFALITQKGVCEIPQQVNIVGNTNICAGTPTTLTADVGVDYVDLYNYLWSNGSTNTSITVTPSASTTYSVTVTNKGCFITSTDAQAITVTALPNVPLPAIPNSMCQGQANAPAVSVSAQPNGVQVFWYSQASGGNPLSPNPSLTYTPVPAPLITTPYYAESVRNGCKSQTRTPVTLTVNPKPTFTTLDTICNANLLTYTIVVTLADGNTVTTTPAFPVTFNPANGTYTISNIPKGTNVTLNASNTSTTCSNTKLVVSPICLCGFVNLPATNSPQDYCSNENPSTLTATVSNGEIAEWFSSMNSPNTIGTGPTFLALGAGLVWVRARNLSSQCVSARVAVEVILNPLPTFEILGKTCAADLSNYSIQFQTDAIPSAPPYSVTNLAGGNFEIAGILANQPLNIHLIGALNSCERDTLVQPAACGCPTDIPKPTTNTPLINPCAGTSNVPPLSVGVPNGLTANWYLNGQLQFGSPNTQLQTTVAGDYWAKTYNPISQCESLDSTKVTLQYKPSPMLSEGEKVCDGSWQTYQITVISSTSTLSASPNIIPSNNGNGTYTFFGIPIASPITITAATNGCIQAITVDPPPVCNCTVIPTMPQNPNNPSMCLGGTMPILSVTIVNPATETIDWYDTPNGGAPLFNPSPIKSQYQPLAASATTDYFAQAKLIQNGNCLSTRVKVTLRVDIPATAVAGANAFICKDEALVLNGTLGGSTNSGTWSAIPLGGTFSPNSGFLQAQTYTPPQNFQGDTIIISLTGFPAQPSVCPSVTGKMVLTVNPVPTITLLDEACEPDLSHYFIQFKTSADDIEFIPNVGLFNLNPDGSYTYGQIPEGVTVTIKARFVNTNCDFTLIPPAKDCPCPTIFKPISLGDKDVCVGSAQFPTLEVEVPAGLTVDWYDAPFGGMLQRQDDASFENPPGAGEYWAEARNIINGCTSLERTLVKLTSVQNPIANAGLDKTVCPSNNNLTITALQGGVNNTYMWSTGQIGTSIQVPVQNATYYLTVSLGTCVSKDTVSVIVLPGITSINFTQTNVSCFDGNDGTMTAIAAGGSAPFQFAWSNASTGATINNLTAGIYTVTVTNDQDCMGTATASITQPLPLVISGTIVQNAGNGMNNGSILVSMTGGTPMYQYQWLSSNNNIITGQTNNLIDSIPPGDYRLRVTDVNGCIFISNLISLLTVATGEPSLAEQIEVFPNPTTGKVFLRFNLQESQEALIETYDMLGQLMMQERQKVSPSDIFEVDLSEMASALYLLRISINGATLTQKISVKK